MEFLLIHRLIGIFVALNADCKKTYDLFNPVARISS